MSDSPEPEPAVDERVASIIDGLLETGEPVEEGQFTLDQDAARTKLDAFTYVDRDAYLIALVEGLFALGAEDLELKTAGPDVEILATDLSLDAPTQALFELYNHRLGLGRQGIDYGLARMAIGLDMILGDEGVERVLVSAAGVSAEYRRAQAPRIVCSPEGEGEPGVRVLVDRSWTQTLNRGPRQSLDQLRAALRWSSRKVLLDAESISGERARWNFAREGEGAGYRFVAGLLAAGDAPSRVELWANDIMLESIPAPGIAFRAELMLDEPPRDLSQMKVVRNEAVNAALEAVEKVRLELVAELAGLAEVWVLDGWPQQWPRERVEAAIADPNALPLTTGLEASRGSLITALLFGTFGLGVSFFAGVSAFSVWIGGSKFEIEAAPFELWILLVIVVGAPAAYGVVWALMGGPHESVLDAQPKRFLGLYGATLALFTAMLVAALLVAKL